jgi:hypothetical protein
MIWRPITEALYTSLRVGAIILPLFLLVDYLNHKYGHAIEDLLRKSRKFMPIVGALLGILPGCNVAVVTAIFFTEGIASLGTLIAVLIAKSDEALYVFLPLGFRAFIPILLAKLVLAILAGYLIDFLPKMKVRAGKIEKDIEFCCAQHPHHDGRRGEILHAIKHTVRVILIVFVTLSLFNYVQDTYGTGFITGVLGHIRYLEPFIASLVGLIPGCGTSIAIATLYVQKVITFGAAVAGLSTASGEVFVVLAARGVKAKYLFRIALILVTISSTAGILLDLIFT